MNSQGSQESLAFSFPKILISPRVICTVPPPCGIDRCVMLTKGAVRLYWFLNQKAKTQSVTIQMNALGKYILMVVLVCNSEPVDENPKCDHSNENAWWVHSNGGIGL